MSRSTKNKTNLAIYDYNLIKPQLTKAGLTPIEMWVLSEICLIMQKVRARKICGSYIAKRMGKSQQWINKVIRKLEKVGLIIRMKTGFTYLHLNKHLKTLTKTIAKCKKQSSKWLKNLIKSRWRNNQASVTSISIKKKVNPRTAINYSRELHPMTDYIPPDRRKFQG